MKKIFAIAFMAVATLTANAQVFIGGEIGYTNTKSTAETTVANTTVSTDGTVNEFAFKPEIGYNFNEDWAIAAKLGYAHASGDGVSNSNTWSINPYVRYTFVHAGNFSVFCDGGIAYSSKHFNGTTDYRTNTNTFSIGVNPGIAYKLSDKVSILAHFGDLSYSTSWYKTKGTVELKNSTDKFNLSAWDSMSFGLEIEL